jgi:hypothetical protein
MRVVSGGVVRAVDVDFVGFEKVDVRVRIRRAVVKVLPSLSVRV